MSLIKVRCHSCGGGCCSKDMLIFLSPNDIFRLRRGLKRKTTDFFKKEFLFMSGLNGLPLVRPVLKNREKSCPFLGSDYCSIFEHRPRICRTAPVLFKNGSYDVVNDCGFDGIEEKWKSYTVNSWNIHNNILPEDEKLDEMHNTLWAEHLIQLDFTKLSQQHYREIVLRLYHFDGWPESFNVDESVLEWDSKELVPMAYHLTLEYVDQLPKQGGKIELSGKLQV